MRKAGRVVAQALDAMAAAVRPGVTLLELDAIAVDVIRRAGATSSFLGYQGTYPNVICASPNEVVVHGIPSKRRLQAGDIIGLDFGVSLEGFHADAARTVGVGPISAESSRLIQVTERSLALAIDEAQAGRRIGDIGAVVQAFVEREGFSIVRDMVGHGIGRRMHEDPQVPNYGLAGSGPRLKAGMTLAIEPMVNAGRPEIEILRDGWTVVSRDGSRSAHFEHTVAVTDGAAEVLTA